MPSPLVRLLPTQGLDGWTPIKLADGGPNARWEPTDDGSLIQTRDVGRPTKSPSGTILLYDEPLASEHLEINLRCTPGSEYQTGLIFNYVDDSNYALFWINRWSASNAAYEYSVVDVRNGAPVTLCTERYFNPPPVTLRLTIRPEATNLRFFVDGAHLYLWPRARFEGESLIGLYSQHNQNASFQLLEATPMSSADPTIPETGTNSDGTTQPLRTTPSPPVPASARDAGALSPFLVLQEPQSKTLIDFTEVFRVPLDSFYTSLYSNSYFDVERAIPLRSTRSFVLDFRPNRWYREYQELLAELKIAESDKASLAQLLEYLEQERDAFLEQSLVSHSSLAALDDALLTALKASLKTARERLQTVRSESETTDFHAEDLATATSEVEYYESKVTELLEDASTPQISGAFDDAAYRERETRLDKVRGNYSLAAEHLYAMRQREALRLREIRTAGYSLQNEATPEEIQNLGYEFHLRGTNVSVAAAFTQYVLPPEVSIATINDDTAWEQVLSGLTANLDGQGVLKLGTEIYDNFQRQAFEVSSVVNNIEIANRLLELEAEISAENADYEAQVAGLDEEIAALTRDQETLAAEASNTEARDFSNFSRLSPAGQHTPFMAHHQNIYSFFSTFQAERAQFNITQTTSAPPWHSTIVRDLAGASVGAPNDKWAYNLESGSEWFSFDANWLEVNDTRYHEHGWHVPGHGNITTDGHEAIPTDQRGATFAQAFHMVARTCQLQIGQINSIDRANLEELHGSRLGAIYLEKSDLQVKGLAAPRIAFVQRWNSPANFSGMTFQNDIVYPDQDPLARSIQELQEGDAESVETHFFDFQSDGFYSDRGLSIREFLDAERNRVDGKKIVAVLPTLDERGRITDDRVTAVVNPRRQEWTDHESLLAPTIKFVETYQMEVTWKGYGLGDLSHSVNLFPGESKELVIEKKTKLTQSRTESRSAEEEHSQKTTDSFEDNLENSFSDQQKSSATSKDKTSRKTENRRVDHAKESQEETETEKYNADVGGNYGPVKGNVGGSQESGTKANWSEDRKKTFVNSFSVDNEKATNQSRDILKKNVHKVVRKVANETSSRNKLQVTSSSTEAFESETAQKEVIRLENPNVGRTINYNFFQVQNLFEITTTLVDVKVVVDPGYEAIEGGRLGDIRVIELEEFGKLYANLDPTEPRSALLAAFVARQVLRKYTSFLDGLESETAALRLTDRVLSDSLRQVLRTVALGIEQEVTEENILDVTEESLANLKAALRTLKGVAFAFQPVVLDEAETTAVNSAAYYLESEVGVRPSTEDYLEDRRGIQTERERALLEQIREQTTRGVFFPELPDTVTHLNLANGHDHNGT